MNRVAFITGAGQGIGKAVAMRLASDGYSLVCADINLERVTDTANALKASSRVMPLQLDVSELAQSRKQVKLIEEAFAPIDVLVNVAGICPTRSFFDIDESTFRNVFEVNVFGLFFLTQAVAKYMVDRKRGSIVNIASVSAFIPKLEQLDYGASKASVVSMTRSMALALGPKGIRVNAIAPGVIDTPLTQSIAEQRAKIRGVSPEETLQPVLDSLPLKRMGTIEEVANAVSFLASDEASYINGQTLNVCGGQLMR